MNRISEADIAHVVETLGCGELQARRHLQGRARAIEAARRQRRTAAAKAPLIAVRGTYRHDGGEARG